MRDVARRVALGALFIIPFLPLFVAHSLFFPFITGKGFAFRILVEIATVSWIVLALMDRRYRPQFSWVLVLYGALVTWLLIANALATNAHKAFWSNFERMDGWVTLIHVFLFFVVAGSMLSVERKWRLWWHTFIGAAALVTGYGLLQIVGAAEIHQSGVRVDASLGNSAYLAAYLLFVIAVTVWRALESAGTLRYVLWALVALEALVLFYTATRGAILGFFAGAIVAAGLYIYESRARTRQMAAGVLALIVLLIGGFMAVRTSSFVESNPTLSRLASISVEEGAPRLSIWRMAGEGIAERPLFGWGQEGFNYVFNTHYEPSMYAQEPWFDRAHNVFLDWAIAGGIPAGLCFIALLFAAVVALYARGAETTRAERALFVGAIAAYAFQALFVFDNLFTYVPLAAIFAMAHAARMRPIKAVERVPELSDQTTSTIAAPIAIAVFAVVVWVVNVTPILAGNRLIHALSSGADTASALTYFKEAANTNSFASQEVAEQSVSYASSVVSSPAIPDAQKLAIAAFSLALMKEEVDAHPNDTRLRLQYASAFRNAGDIQSAIAEIVKARELSPKKQQIFLQQGLLEWERGNRAAAASLFDAAYALDTSFKDLAAYAAAGAYITNDVTKARRILTETFGTTIVDHDILAYAYFEMKRYDDLIALWQLRAETGGAEAGYRLALAYLEAGRKAEALATVDRTLAAYPGSGALAAQVRSQILAP